MPYYECVFIARQDVPSAQVESLTETFSNIITENGGKVEKTEFWGLKTLAYKIKKNRKGHYVLLNLDSPHAAVAEMERQMGISDDVLRTLTIKVDALEEGPSMMMQSRAGRDAGRRDHRDRGDRGDRPDRGDRGDRGDRPPRDRVERSEPEQSKEKAVAGTTEVTETSEVTA
jgi:small subunit ribosomal protein S6